jgi:hypothetical protein
VGQHPPQPPSRHPTKVVRSYRLVFRRRWRIFRIQGWRIPLPGGIELRLLGYWLASLAAMGLLCSLPLLGAVVSAAPASLRLLALPLASAWLLCRWEVDGRPPHRALLGLIAWRLRPRDLAALRRVPPRDAELTPVAEVAAAPDLTAPVYPRGRLRGPARLLLRYPVAVEPGTRCWRLRARRSAPLHSGKTVEVPRGRVVLFEGSSR